DTGLSTVFSGKKKTAEKIDATLEDIDIHAIDYEQEISRAVSVKDFRLAVRLWFLRTLKKMTDQELVRYSIDKTNSDYYYELSGTPYQENFSNVSRVYDFVWYGEFEIDENKYRDAETKFEQVNRQLSAKPQ
ncbi:MAG TPA: hypothetical protein VFU15_04550, partial [Bacteroidia bacterium]|nr:hypothetical protein [Bacteroidia bacterium]